MRLRGICALAVLVVCLAWLGGCGPRFLIPTFDTARDQLMFARAQKQNQLPSMDPKKRNRQLRSTARAFEEVIKRFPDDIVYTPPAYIGMGEVYYTFHEYKDAVKVYRAALKKYPDQEDIQLFALYGLALSHDRLRNYEKAQSYYKECIDRFRDDEREEVQEIIRECEVLYRRVRTE